MATISSSQLTNSCRSFCGQKTCQYYHGPDKPGGTGYCTITPVLAVNSSDTWPEILRCLVYAKKAEPANNNKSKENTTGLPQKNIFYKEATKTAVFYDDPVQKALDSCTS